MVTPVTVKLAPAAGTAVAEVVLVTVIVIVPNLTPEELVTAIVKTATLRFRDQFPPESVEVDVETVRPTDSVSLTLAEFATVKVALAMAVPLESTSFPLTVAVAVGVMIANCPKNWFVKSPDAPSKG